MAKNYVQAGVNLTLPAPYTVASGGGVLIGGIFGVAAGDAQSGADVDIVTEGIWDLPKDTATVFSVGEPAFWDDGDKRLYDDNDTAESLTRIGVAVAPAGNGATTVRVRLNGTF